MTQGKINLYEQWERERLDDMIRCFCSKPLFALHILGHTIPDLSSLQYSRVLKIFNEW